MSDLNRRARVESAMFEFVKRRESAPPDVLRGWALELGVPDDARRSGGASYDELRRALHDQMLVSGPVSQFTGEVARRAGCAPTDAEYEAQDRRENPQWSNTR